MSVAQFLKIFFAYQFLLYPQFLVRGACVPRRIAGIRLLIKAQKINQLKVILEK